MNFSADPDFEPNFYDEASGSGLTTSKFVLLAGILVLESNDVQNNITDGSGGDVVATIPSNTPVGTWIECGNVKLESGAYFNENSATSGQFNFVAKKYVKGV